MKGDRKEDSIATLRQSGSPRRLGRSMETRRSFTAETECKAPCLPAFVSFCYHEEKRKTGKLVACTALSGTRGYRYFGLEVGVKFD